MFSLTSSGRNALLSPEYHWLNFEPMIEKITVGKGAARETRVIRMTKDGFMYMVLGLKVAKAGYIKERYITAFKAMADQ